MTTKFNTLLSQVKEIHDISKAQAVLSWDREVNMPKAGIHERIQQMTTLRKIAHQLATSDEFGKMISEAKTELNGASSESFEASLIRHLEFEYERQQKLTPDLVRRISQTSGAARDAWVQARSDNDFSYFLPHLEKVVALCQEMAEAYGYEDEKYDALLTTYEKGMKTADVRAIFNAYKTDISELREAIFAKVDSVDDSFLHQTYPIDKQKEFAYYIAEAAGYDLDRGHLGTVVHPFASSFSRNDCRITTRWYENFINASIFGTLHESGHAMYEQGTHPDFSRTPLARGTSMGFHESQSRTIENIIGRSRGFWEKHYPKLQSLFPEQLGNHSTEDFYRAINKVHPSLIRVEADELTYNFHIILRFELEQAMLNGELAPEDLPEAWSAKMQDLLGITPPNHTLGCLQDVHWSGTSFGYFPTYALGNLYAAQLFETAVKQDPTINSKLDAGDPSGLVTWLRENVHQYGKKYAPSELILKATGSPLSHEPFIRYAKNKFTDIYNL